MIEFEAVICVQCSRRSYCHPDVLSKYITINGDDGLRLIYSWITLNGVVLALDEQEVRLYCCVLEFEAVIRETVIISP